MFRVLVERWLAAAPRRARLHAQPHRRSRAAQKLSRLAETWTRKRYYITTMLLYEIQARSWKTAPQHHTRKLMKPEHRRPCSASPSYKLLSTCSTNPCDSVRPGAIHELCIFALEASTVLVV
jgi:hypothetical protein